MDKEKFTYMNNVIKETQNKAFHINSQLTKQVAVTAFF